MINIGVPIEEELRESFKDAIFHISTNAVMMIIISFYYPWYGIVLCGLGLAISWSELHTEIFPSTDYRPQAMEQKLR